MRTVFILSVGSPSFQGTLVRTLDDSLPVVVDDFVELWPSGFRAKVRARTYLPDVRAYEVLLEGGFLAAETLRNVLEHGWEVVVK